MIASNEDILPRTLGTALQFLLDLAIPFFPVEHSGDFNHEHETNPYSIGYRSTTQCF